MRGYSNGIDLAVQHTKSSGLRSGNMTDAGEQNEEWAQAWIDEQREKLKNSADEGRQSTEDGDFSGLWARLGSEWLSGFEKLLRTGFLGSAIPLGWGREREQEWRDLALAQAQYRQVEADLLAKLMTIQTQALDRLERAVRARAQENRPLSDIRELYELWIDCGEEVYAEVARSEDYCRLQAAVGNASVRLRANQQKILERGLKYFDLPTRSELNSVHRELRALREELAELRAAHSRPSRRAKHSKGVDSRVRARAARKVRK